MSSRRVVEEAPTRSLAERLFTPENVRILQSLGIGIIFISAIALVRNQIWAGANNLERLGILLGGTLGCYALGAALHRWTSLRITSLALLILAELALILNSYAVLLPDSGQHALYPYSAASLWTATFLLFTAISHWHARTIKEALFDAFTVFGGFAAWGAAALWLNMDWLLLPAAFVPALVLCRVAAARHAPSEEGFNRWSLAWWLKHAWAYGSVLLAVTMQIAAVIASLRVDPQGGNELAAQFPAHAAGMALLAILCLVPERAQKAGRLLAHVGSALLVLLPLLAGLAWGWTQAEMLLALALTGAAGVLLKAGVNLAGERATCVSPDRANSFAASTAVLEDWGEVAVSVASLATLLSTCTQPLSVVPPLIAVLVSSIGTLSGRKLAPWLAAAHAIVLGVSAREAFNWAPTMLPLLWIGAAGLLYLCCRLATRVTSAESRADSSDVAFPAHGLAMMAASVLLFHSLNGTGCYTASWWLLVAYALGVAVLQKSAPFRHIALVLTAPALGFTLKNAGIPANAAGPYLCLLATGAFGIEALAWRRAKVISAGGLWSIGFIAAHALLHVLLAWAAGAHATVALCCGLLAALLIAISIVMRKSRLLGALTVEIAALGLVACAGFNIQAHLGYADLFWPAGMMLVSAAVLVAATLAEFVGTRLVKLNSAEVVDSAVPFRVAGERVVLVLSTLSFASLIYLHARGWAVRELIMLGTAGSVLPLYLSARYQARRDAARLGPAAILADILTFGFLSLAGLAALQTGFWRLNCSPVLKQTCALYFGACGIFSVLSGVLVGAALAPVGITLSLLGLLGSAYGAWPIPVESFGVSVAILALSLSLFGRWSATTQRFTRMSMAANTCALGTFVLSAAVMLNGLFLWPSGNISLYGVAGWLVLTVTAALYALQRRSALAGTAASACAALAACAALRWAGVAWLQFGPGLGCIALSVLLLRQAARMREHTSVEAFPRRLQNGLLGLAGAFAFAAFGVGLVGAFFGYQGSFAVTLLELALGAAMLSVVARHENLRWPPALPMEVLSWLLLGGSVFTAADVYSIELTGALPALLGAIFLVLGMAAESVAGAMLGAEKHSPTPTPFLETRFGAAAVLAVFGIVKSFVQQHAIEPAIVLQWQSLFSASLLAIFMSMARSSNDARWTGWIRVVASAAGFVVLLPASYLCFLKSMSTGSSFGALWFMLLLPVLWAAAHVLDREKLSVQSAMAKLAVALVNAGALTLAFTNNADHLPIVPALVLALIAMQAAFARRLSERPEFTQVAGLAATAAVLFGVRQLIGYGLDLTPWFGEMPLLGLLGVGLLGAGAYWRVDEDPRGRSVLGLLGATLTLIALAFSAQQWLLSGADVRSMPGIDVLRRDAFTVCVLLVSATAMGARYWLDFAAGGVVAPVCAMAGYLLFVFRAPIHEWEWITLPVAAFLFLWAREQALQESENERPSAGTNVLLGLASAAALIPSFVQAVPYEPGALYHVLLLFLTGMALVLGAMATRRKIPLLSASGTILLLTIVKAIQWASLRQELLLPFIGIIVGFGVLGLGTLFEARMNRAIRNAVDLAKAEARMFWISWQ